jgi:phenylalanyl-tRNA synthetase alpha chain
MPELLKKLHPLERRLLPKIKENSTLSELVALTGMKEVEAMRALQWLENKGLVKIEKHSAQSLVLDSNGKEYAKKGLPEERLLRTLSKGPKQKHQAKKDASLDDMELNVSLGILRRSLAIEMGSNLTLSITKNGKNLLEKGFEEAKLVSRLAESQPVPVSKLSLEQKYAYESLKKRRAIIKVIDTKDWSLAFSAEALKASKELSKGKAKYADKLTPEMLREKKWKSITFRHFDVSINVPERNTGKLNFIDDTIDFIKKTWLELGFQEMEGNMIQTAFWDLDALFVPQDHPAREMQDTFYIDESFTEKIDTEILERVKKTHETGGDTGSTGWKYAFDKGISQKLLLRTHTTVLSAQAIAKIKKSDMPAKFFSVGKVFRNEATDTKHLFEFYQVEGIVVDPNANFVHLKGYLEQFYKKMGYESVRINPSYFPYTEPSLEVEVFDKHRNSWIELGGAGIFRPEVTKTLIGEEVPVLAWGLGMERIIVPYFGIKDLRELYKNDIEFLRKAKRFIRW